MRQEGRGIGLENKLHAYLLQETGLDTVEANENWDSHPINATTVLARRYCETWGITKMKLLTNNPKKYAALTGYGLEIVERVPIVMEPKEENKHYLRTKKKS